MTECGERRPSELQTNLDPCRAESWGTRLKLYTSRSSAALKMVELPPTAANPTRVRRWLESSPPHISLVFSPLKERGPPPR